MSGNQQPQGQQNPLSSFGFKPMDTSTTTSTPTSGFSGFGTTPSLFNTNAAQSNTANNATAPKAPLFGGGTFGSSQNTPQGTQQPSSSGNIFGSSGAQTSSLFSTPPKFGTTTTNATPNPLFGGTTPSNTQNAASGGAVSNVPAAPASNIFGSAPNNQPAQPGITLGGGTASAPGEGSLFGTKPQTELFGNSGAPKTAAALQPALNIFGASKNNQGAETTSTLNPPVNASGSATTPAVPSAFGNFGLKSGDTSSQPGIAKAAPTSVQTSLPSLFGSNNLSAKPATPAPSGAATPSTGPSAFPSLFANLQKNSDTTPASKSAAEASEKDPKAVIASDGSKEASKVAGPGKDGAPTASPFAGFNVGDANTSKPATTSGTVPTSNATSNVISVPAPSTLRGKTVEDIVNRWATELETHTGEFAQFANEVAAWDRTLIENGNYISALYATVLAAESTQASLDQSLDHVEQQQRHLTATLDQYEKSANEILHGPGGIITSTEGLELADSERDKSYALAANLYTQLDDLSRSLTQMVESVNSLNLSPGSSQDDVMSTIVGILNAHLTSLQWIDGSLNEVEAKVKDTERKFKDSSARGPRVEGMNKSRSYGLGSSKR